MKDPQQIAYEVTKAALRDAKRIATQQFLELAENYDPHDIEDMDTAIRCVNQAADLCYHAEKITSEMIQRTDPTKAIEQLKRRRPGFPDEVYRKTINESVFEIKR